eukprot:scaffold1272_cov250-Pinguiococcus_pyrenoidosus.AAC.47
MNSKGWRPISRRGHLSQRRGVPNTEPSGRLFHFLRRAAGHLPARCVESDAALQPDAHQPAAREDQSARVRLPGCGEEHGAVSVGLAGACELEILRGATLRALVWFEVREPLSFKHLWKNPMMLMAVVMIGAMAFMPKMMGSMDKDQMKEMQEEMAKAQDPSQLFSSFFGGGGNDDDDD